MKARMYLLLNLQYETLTLLFLPVDILLSTLRLVRKHPPLFPICLLWSAELSYPNTLTGAQRTDMSCMTFPISTSFLSDGDSIPQRHDHRVSTGRNQVKDDKDKYQRIKLEHEHRGCFTEPFKGGREES